MSQGNWGGGGPPGGGGGWGGQGGGGGGYGQPPGAPPGGGGYGPPGAPPGGGGYGPPGAPPGGGGYGPPGAPPGGGGYGPPGAPPGGAPPGGYGPPGGAPPGGYGPPGGAPPGGGYGPPPGAPPGGGYGPPPGAPPGGGWGAPPGGAFGGAPMAPSGPSAFGTRAQFTGDGGKFFGTFLLYGIAPIFAVQAVAGAFFGIGIALESAVRADGIIFAILAFIGGLAACAGLLIAPLLFMNKYLEFYFENLRLDGQTCKYVGTLGGLIKVQLVNSILTSITFGIYTPWALVKLKSWTYENVEVGGQRGRLTFHGEGATLFGTYLLGTILTSCTAGIYGAWFANDLFAYFWENSRVDGRPFAFKKDPGGFLGTYILTVLLSYCTLGIYLPWGLCNLLKWEAERVS